VWYCWWKGSQCTREIQAVDPGPGKNEKEKLFWSWAVKRRVRGEQGQRSG